MIDVLVTGSGLREIVCWPETCVQDLLGSQVLLWRYWGQLPTLWRLKLASDGSDTLWRLKLASDADQLKDWLPRDSPSTFDMDSGGIDSNSGNPEIVNPEIDEPEESPLDRHDTEPSDIDRLPGTESGSGNSDTHSPIEETGSADSGPVSPTDDTPDSRYPSRVRRAPHRYDPSDFGTFNFLVI